MQNAIQKGGEPHKRVHERILNAQEHINGAISRFLSKSNRLEDEQRVLYALNVFVHYLHEDTIGEMLPKMVVNLYSGRPVEDDITERGTVHDIGLF